MAGDKDIQTQDQAYQVQDCCAVVDDNMDCSHYVCCNKDRMKKENKPSQLAVSKMNSLYQV